jgi:hypothetical protein
MSQARVHRAAKARKEWTCGKCGDTVKVGEPVLSFSVGFRGREQRRCTKPGCYPTREELESSMVSSVYGVIDAADWDGDGSFESIQATLEEVVEVIREVAGEYENSEMFDKNEDLQQRAETLNAAADEIEAWQPDEDKPDWIMDEYRLAKSKFEDALDTWLGAARESAKDRVEGVELP